MNERKAGVIRQNMTPDFVTTHGPGQALTGIDGDERMMLGMYEAMPGLHVSIEDMIAEGDKVMCRNVCAGPKPGVGQSVLYSFAVSCFGDSRREKIAERWATVTPPSEGDTAAGT